MRATPHWLGDLCTWWNVGGPSAVLIVPPLGYEYFASHATLKQLADTLAERGFTVVRFDLHGNGDSAGLPWESDRLGAWRRSVRHVAQALRQAGASSIHAVGLRFGATLALELDDVDSVVAWAPVVSGRRWMRELRMLAVPTPDSGFTFAGTVFSQETMEALSSLSIGAARSKRVLLLSRPSEPLDTTRSQLGGEGAAVELEMATGTELMLDVAAEEAVVPVALLRRIADWLGAPQGGRMDFSPCGRTTLPWRDGTVEETFVEVAGMPGIVASGQAGKPTVVFLNSGSEVHVGPGRAWVEYARDLSLAGYATLRIDWPGWGENFVDKPGRPYDEHCLDATLRLARELRAQGRQVVLVGLCAGAWVALQAALRGDVAQVIAINGQYYWRRGHHPILARLPAVREHRTEERLLEEKLERLGIWSILDFFGARHQAAKWMSGLTKRGVSTLLLYSKGDDGLEHLRTRLGRSLARELSRGVVQLAEIDDLDHQMYRGWRRSAVVSAMLDFLSGATQHEMIA